MNVIYYQNTIEICKTSEYVFFGHVVSWISFFELGIFTEGEIILDGFSNKLHFSGKKCSVFMLGFWYTSLIWYNSFFNFFCKEKNLLEE